MSAQPFRLGDALAALGRTPAVLRALLQPLPEAWHDADDGTGTWSSRQVVAHLLDGERTDWAVRARLILAHGESRPFAPYDRDASIATAGPHALGDLLDGFEEARAENVAWLHGADLSVADLDRTGLHPDLGRVTLRQLLATWVAHDHAHVLQIARTLARQSRHEVGPWAAYLSVFGGR